MHTIKMGKDTTVKNATMRLSWLGLDDSASPNPYLDLQQLREQHLDRFPDIKRYLLDETNQITLKIKDRGTPV